MPRGATIVVENNFTKGLITEFTAMNYPENSITDGDNCVFSELGSVTRRPGMDFEPGAEVHSMVVTSFPNTYTEFEWASVSNDGTKTFVVQQIGPVLLFFENAGGAISSNRKSFSVNVSTFATAGTTVEQVSQFPCQFTTGKGYLFVVHPFCSPFYIQYHQDTDTITTAAIAIQVRDFEGVDDGLAIQTRPATLSNLHKYNLFNQGWYQTARTNTAADSDEGQLNNVLTFWDSQRSDFPSNSDIWWLFKNAGDVFVPQNIDKHAIGNTPAPRGHYIYDAFNINRTAVTGITGLPSKTAGRARPSSIAFFAGRIFYAGTSADGYSDQVFFTQIIESDDQFGKCYQANDLTSETVFDLIDSDGGTIRLSTISKVVALKVIGEVLIVIGTDGIFAIRGTENGPFRATDYTVEYVSNIGGVSHLSVVDIGGALLWWNNQGLYSLSKDQVGLSFVVENVSKSTIQTVLDSVPAANKESVKGAFNRNSRLVQWVFSDILNSPAYEYNRILELNVISKAFYTYTIDRTLGPRLAGLVAISGSTLTTFTDTVVTSTEDLVVTSTDDPVTVSIIIETPGIEEFKYFTVGDIFSETEGFTYSEMSSPFHKDWTSFDDVGVGYDSFFESGYRIRGEFLRKFNSTPIAVVLRPESGGQVLFDGIWDYGERTTTVQQLYRDTLGDYLVRRVKLRGKGRSLQLRFTSSGIAPFDIIGWSTFDSGGQVP